jgi:hypothetical protein
MHHNRMREAIRKAICLSDLIRIINGGSINGFVNWLNDWSDEERRQAQNDLAALIELERVIRKELVDRGGGASGTA